jgi:ankyrin repeat protein
MSHRFAIIAALAALLAATSPAGEIHAAAAAGYLNKVKALLEAEPTLLESKGGFGDTPLITACDGAQLAVANFLIGKGANIHATNDAGATPLYFAAARSLDLTQLLIARKAGVNVRAYVDSGYTPLHEAAISGNLKVAKLLIDRGADLNFRGSVGTALQRTIYNKKASATEMAKLLLASGAKLQQFSFGNTELHVAALRNYAEIVPILVKYGADVNAANQYGHTPLYYAARHGYRKAAEALIAAGADRGAVGLANGYLNPNELAGQNITILTTHPVVVNRPSVSELAKRLPDAKFVLSSKPAEAGDVRLAAPHESFSIGGIQVHTIAAGRQSEALGYLVEVDGLKIFHAGLHSLAGNSASEMEKYRKEIDFLKPFGPIDFAILPIRGRHVEIVYEPYLYLLDQLSPKAVYLIGDDLRTEEHRKCITVLRTRDVPVFYPEGGLAIGERFHYVREQAAAPRPSSYLDERSRFQTRLTRRAPAHGSQNQPAPPPGVDTVVYPSGELKLRAWLSVPEAARTKPAPALVFFHGGSEIHSFFVERARPFQEAGFVIMFPMLRGENGNPGVHEALLGEIDDAAAAVRWLASQPSVDRSRIYAYGHSTGAAVSLLLSLRNDAPVRLGGGSSALWTSDELKSWRDAPFDVNDERERRMRAPFDFIRTMGRRHVAFVGRQEYSAERVAAFRRLAEGSLLEIREVEGDHMGCFQPAVAEFLEIVRRDLLQPTAGRSSSRGESPPRPRRP